MNPQTLLYIYIAILISGYLFNLWLGRLNHKSSSLPIPERLAGVYDSEKYKKQQAYDGENYRFGLLSGFLSFAAILIMLIFGWFGLLDSYINAITEKPVFQSLLFFAILALASDILSLPLQIYHTFIIEEKYEFNKTSVKTFIFDKIKGWLLGAVIGGGLLLLIIYLYQVTGKWFWVLAWMVITVFSLLLNYFYSTLIVPLFNKLTPLETGELRDSLMNYAETVDFNLKNVYVINGSKRSTKANAYFSGFGKKKKVVLYDTLIAQHSVEELTAVLAHEIGHYKLKHLIKGIIISILYSGFMMFLLSVFLKIEVLPLALGAEKGSFHMAILAFGLLYSPVSELIEIVMNRFSRKHEYEADAFAAKTYAAEPLVNGLMKLSAENLSNLTPHPWYVLVNYSHPTLYQRVTKLDTFIAPKHTSEL